MFIFLKYGYIHVLQHGVSNSLQPLRPVPVGVDLLAELLRWDQRLFATVSKVILYNTDFLIHPPVLYVRGLFLHVLSLAHPNVYPICVLLSFSTFR